MAQRMTAMPSTRQLLSLFGVRARKQLSQNFLLDKHVLSKIVRRAGAVDAPVALEVGPGPGGLTRALLTHGVQRVVAVEKDDRFISLLSGLQQDLPDRLFIHHGDALRVNEADLLAPHLERPDVPADAAVHILGNLPFNISTPLLVKWLHALHAGVELGTIADSRRITLTLLLQSEVAERLVAQPGTKNYGRLSVLTQLLCDTELLFQIPGSAFVPAPRVSATLAQLSAPGTLHHAARSVSWHELTQPLRHGFGQRRKSLRRVFPHLDQAGLQVANLDGLQRPDALSPSQWLDLCRVLALRRAAHQESDSR